MNLKKIFFLRFSSLSINALIGVDIYFGGSHVLGNFNRSSRLCVRHLPITSDAATLAPPQTGSSKPVKTQFCSANQLFETGDSLTGGGSTPRLLSALEDNVKYLKIEIEYFEVRDRLSLSRRLFQKLEQSLKSLYLRRE